MRNQRAIPRGREHAIIHRAEGAAADPDKVKALDRLNGLRSEGIEEAEPMQDLLAVRLDGLNPWTSQVSLLPLDDADANAALRERQSQDRAAASGADDDDLISGATHGYHGQAAENIGSRSVDSRAAR